MAEPPTIPAEIRRAVLAQAGHRCSVCGTPCPLARAHVIPWRPAEPHQAEDLICLCTNCRRRAEQEKWDREAWLRYRRQPWVSRQSSLPEPPPTTRVRLVIGTDLDELDGHRENMLVHGLAVFLDLSHRAIRMVARKPGSREIAVDFVLPADAAATLRAAGERSAPELRRHLAAFEIAAIRQPDDDAAPRGDITLLLEEWSGGDPQALHKLAPLVNEELRRIARRAMAGERQDHTLQPTALVNEAFQRLMQRRRVSWRNSAQFYGFASQLMCRILVDAARGKQAAKRGAGIAFVTLDDVRGVAETRDVDLVALDQALKELERFDPEAGRVVVMRFFGGLTHSEIAEVLGVPLIRVRRRWDTARLWLFRELSNDGAPP